MTKADANSYRFTGIATGHLEAVSLVALSASELIAAAAQSLGG